MFNLFDENFDAITLLDGVLILNQAVNPEMPLAWVEQELEKLLVEAQQMLAKEYEPKKRFDSFLELFYRQWGFIGDNESYFHSSNVLIDKVLERRKGIPISLGALLLYFGNKFDFPIQGIMFPTQFLVRLHWQNEAPIYINPFNGEAVSLHTLKSWLIGNKGPFVQLKPNHLVVANNSTVIGHWLALIKGAFLREEHFTFALRCTDLALTFVPDDPYEIRDRGFIYQQLDCDKMALSDYQYFIEHCPNDPAAELLKHHVSMLSRRRVTVH